MMSKSVVLDASALLALMHREPGSSIVAENLKTGAIISAVNMAEVIAKQDEYSIPVQETISYTELLGIHIHGFDEHAALKVGQLRKATKQLGLSLADRACLALGQRLQCPVITADRAWTKLDIGVEIRCIR